MEHPWVERLWAERPWAEPRGSLSSQQCTRSQANSPVIWASSRVTASPSPPRLTLSTTGGRDDWRTVGWASSLPTLSPTDTCWRHNGTGPKWWQDDVNCWAPGEQIDEWNCYLKKICPFCLLNSAKMEGWPLDSDIYLIFVLKLLFCTWLFLP